VTPALARTEAPTVPFAYFRRLGRADQEVYRRSDGIHEVRLPSAEAVRDGVPRLERALATGDCAEAERAADALVRELSRVLEVPPPQVKVLAIRPRMEGAELHGFYVAEPGRRPVVRVWMRTAARRQVVAFRTFLRTLLHEFVHHLDFELLRLPKSFHTQGFYERESSLVHALLPGSPGPPGRGEDRAGPGGGGA